MQINQAIIVLVIFFKHVGGLPVSFEILNNLVSEKQYQYDYSKQTLRTKVLEPVLEISQEEVDEPSQEAAQNIPDAPRQTTTNKNAGIGSIFDEYVWLDNALQFVGDRFFRLIGLLIKKYIFKQTVNFTDLF